MVYPFQHNNALEPANPRRGASGAVWRGSRKATARKLAAFREPHAKPCSQARKSRCARFSMLRAPARLNYVYRRHFSANPFGFAAQRGVMLQTQTNSSRSSTWVRVLPFNDLPVAIKTK